MRLLNLGTKGEVQQYCRTLVIRSEDFASAILGAQAGALAPYRYANHFRQVVPDDVEPTGEELHALGTAKVGPLTGKALKAVRKTGQLFRTRRMLAVHLFFTPSRNYWHLFYFDQRDFERTGNHWKHGPHIHYCHDSFVSEPLDVVWANVTARRPSLPKAIHVRYDYHHNRRAGV